MLQKVCLLFSLGHVGFVILATSFIVPQLFVDRSISSAVIGVGRRNVCIYVQNRG